MSADHGAAAAAAAATAAAAAKAEDQAVKRFAMALVGQAVDGGWEDHELARLVLLVAKEREMTSKKTIKVLTDCRICNPVVLARLADDGLSFDVPQIIHAMYNQAGHPDRFIEAVKDGLEQGIVSPKDAVAVQALYEIGVTMGDRQFNRFARVLCDQARSKKVCGQVLTVFSSHLQVRSHECGAIRMGPPTLTFTLLCVCACRRPRPRLSSATWYLMTSSWTCGASSRRSWRRCRAAWRSVWSNC